MNHGPLSIIRNTFISLLSCFFIYCIIWSKKYKKYWLILFASKRPNTINHFYYFYLVTLFCLVYFILLLLVLYLLTRNLVLDNHTVELETKDFILLCRIARSRGEGQLFTHSPRVRYEPSSQPCGEDCFLNCTLCTWSPCAIRRPAIGGVSELQALL
jgi:hypothetical protein